MTKEERKAYMKNWRIANHKICEAYRKEWRATHPRSPKQIAKDKERMRLWRKNNPNHGYKTPEEKEQQAKRHQQWYKKNSQKIRNQVRDYQKKSRDKIRVREKEYIKRRKEQSQEYRIKYNIRSAVISRIRTAMKTGRKSAHTIELLGCSIEQFKKYIQSLWKPGMSWDNYGYRGWHLDHKTPIASFDLTDPEQQKKCFHWSNIQPLWASENYAKGSRY